MRKSLKINNIVAILTVAALLMSCGNSNNGTSQQGNSDATATTETSQKPTDDESKALEEVIKQQEDNTPKDIDDEPLPIETLMKSYTAPSELKYYKQSDEYIFEKFYPIGWSKDGKFAYVLEPPDEGAGLYFFKLIIRDMIKDADIYVWEPQDELETGSVKEMWKQYNMTFAQKLNEYKIIPQKNIELIGTEFQNGNNKYKVIIENKMETDPDFGFEVVKSTTIHIKSPELGTKQIYSYTENDYNICLGKMVQGVIKSPYENRVAVLVRTEERGYEGPPNVIKSLLIGAGLELTFKK